MARNENTPALPAGVSRNQLGGWLHPSPTASDWRAQFLIASHRVRPALAATIAALAFGGSSSHG